MVLGSGNRRVEETLLREYCICAGYQVATVSQLLYNADCCGNACRHCPYNHANVNKPVRKSKTWNGAFFV